jgi:hypothetical protein
VPHKARRTAVLRFQVDEIRERQRIGALPTDLDPALMRLFAFALSTYPGLLPQITRMTVGLDVDDEEFGRRRTAFLRDLSRRIESGAADAAAWAVAHDIAP